MDPNETDGEAQPGLIKRIVTIPCMRNSLMYGISGGLAVGLTHFLFTSNVRRATNLGFGGYILILFGTWGVCRYKLAQQRYNAHQWQKAQQSKLGHIKHLDPKDV